MADPQAKPPVPDGAEASLPGTLAALTALAPEAGMVDLDPALFGRALGAAALSAARHPESAARAGLRCALDLARTSLAAASRAAGHSVAGPMPHDAADRRFSDPAWEDNAAFFALRQSYLVLRRLSEDLLAAAELDTATRAKAVFAARLLPMRWPRPTSCWAIRRLCAGRSRPAA